MALTATATGPRFKQVGEVTPGVDVESTRGAAHRFRSNDTAPSPASPSPTPLLPFVLTEVVAEVAGSEGAAAATDDVGNLSPMRIVDFTGKGWMGGRGRGAMPRTTKEEQEEEARCRVVDGAGKADGPEGSFFSAAAVCLGDEGGGGGGNGSQQSIHSSTTLSLSLSPLPPKANPTSRGIAAS